MIEESKAERAKADATMAELAKSKQEAVKVISDTRDFLKQDQDYKQRFEQGEDVSPPAPTHHSDLELSMDPCLGLA